MDRERAPTFDFDLTVRPHPTLPRPAGEGFGSLRAFRFLATALLCISALLPAAAQNAVPTRLASTLEAAGYSAIPMTRHGDAHLTVEARINGVAGTFILDTGAGRTVIDRAAQSRFDEGRATVAAGRATGAGSGGLAIAALPGNRLAIGDYRDDAFTAHFLALDHVNAAFANRGEAPVAGVLGADVLERGGAVIDYPNLRLYLRNPDADGGAVASPSNSSEQR
ncbi:retropepsin-like aspartic protease [Luteimonas terrae]|uniref:retropepsin-like aspartic protease n=1 Tax=Luteimonas terrae TaxID=1530191 RepID=UPI001404EC6A|nr:retropepsin-like aspartic protease [Luteimonas terrae]